MATIAQRTRNMIGRIAQAAVRRWRRLLGRIDRVWVRIGTRSRSATRVYYFLHRTFDREMRSALAGRQRYRELQGSPGTSSTILRRNTHRLEKGLIMRPRRSVFARDYIAETMEAFRAATAARTRDAFAAEEYEWTRAVLREYFAVTGAHAVLDPLRLEFARLDAAAPSAACGTTSPRTPYVRTPSAPTVSHEALLALARQRRSVRWFLPHPVPRELLRRAMEVGTLSPSACNRQPFVFQVYDDPARLRGVVDLPAGTEGFAHNVPCMIVVVGRQRHYYDERDRHVIYIDAALAVMSFILALETLGLSSCCINWADIEDREARAARILHLADDERPVMFLAVGWPDPEGLVPSSVKKPPEDLLLFPP